MNIQATINLFLKNYQLFDRYLFLHLPKYKNILSHYYTNIYQDEILRFGVSELQS